MCNNCDCEGFDRCSIVEFKPFGYCCPMCVNYDAAHSCEYYEPVVASSFSEELHILPKAFCLKTSENKKSEKIMLYP